MRVESWRKTTSHPSRQLGNFTYRGKDDTGRWRWRGACGLPGLAFIKKMARRTQATSHLSGVFVFPCSCFPHPSSLHRSTAPACGQPRSPVPSKQFNASVQPLTRSRSPVPATAVAAAHRSQPSAEGSHREQHQSPLSHRQPFQAKIFFDIFHE